MILSIKMSKIHYKSGYRYQLAEKYSCKTELSVQSHILTDFIGINLLGKITIEKYYCWDGPSGPAIDTKNFMRGSLVHDALYQLMRQGQLDPFHYRKPADELLRAICREDGMSRIRSWWVYHSLRQFGYKAATRGNKKQILIAPKGG